MTRPNRRAFLQQAATAALLTATARPQQPSSGTFSFLPILRIPDTVTAFSHFDKTFPAGELRLTQTAGGKWLAASITITTDLSQAGLALALSAPAQPVALVHIRWNLRVPTNLLILGDAWERSYGELGWRTLVPERVLPWYFATHEGLSEAGETHGYGVRTDARALCFWQLDERGVSLWLNITNGGDGVRLGERTLTMATVVAHQGVAGQSSYAAVRALCQALAARPVRPVGPIYGCNDWNYSYGNSTSTSILDDTKFIVGLSPAGSIRPFSVIDGGWEDGTTSWPDMGQLSSAIRNAGARPGIWVRPLEAPAKTSPGLLLPAARSGVSTCRTGELAYDPTHPDAQEKIRAKIRQLTGWQYEMIKHDFSTYDLTGRWGFEMGPQPTFPGWSLYDRTVTNAEALTALYTLIRQAAGERTVICGCNTVGHLTQGHFEIQRTGDDTSGRQWERTRRMGVNTASFRLPQQGTFFAIDADLVGITDAIPWEFNRQWLEMLSRSGVVTMVSPGQPARGQAQQSAIRDAFKTAVAGGVDAKAADWLTSTAPTQWQSAGAGNRTYDWNGSDGTSPYLGP